MKNSADKFHKITTAIFIVLVATFLILLAYVYYLYSAADEQVKLMQSFQVTINEVNVFGKEFLDWRQICLYSIRSVVVFSLIITILSCGLMVILKTSKYVKRTSINFFIGLGIFFFFHLEYINLHLHKVMDDNGVEIYYYGYQKHNHAGYQRNPLFIASQSMSYYQEYLDGNQESLKLFYNTIEWLKENRTIENGVSYFIYDYDILEYEMRAPWKSGLANSRAVLAFRLAHEVSKDSVYLDIARSCILAYNIPVEEGGFLVDMKGGKYWYAEYPRPDGSTPLVLNGMMSILIALHTFQEYSDDDFALDLFDKGIAALKYELPNYDIDGGSYYDQKSKVAYDSYHLLHISQLNQLYRMTNEAMFKEYHEKWSAYAVEQGWSND